MDRSPLSERLLVGAVHVGVVQGAVAYVVHRLRTLPAAESDRRLADHGQHAHRRHLLCTVRRPRHHPHPIIRHIQAAVQRKGMFSKGRGYFYDGEQRY